MPNSPRNKWVIRWRRLMIASTIMAAGVLPNHLSCSHVLQDSVTEGVSDFLSKATTDLLTLILYPDGLNPGNGGGSGDDDDDPFEPPVQG